MTLPCSGPISAKMINTEFNRWGAQNYEGTFRLSQDGAQYVNKSYQQMISYSEFRCLSSAAPIDSSISGGTCTTSGGYKICTLTNTNAEGCWTINSIATGSYENKVYCMYVGAGGSGGGGGKSHHYESNGSITGGGGGGGYVFYKTQVPMAGYKYCGKPGKHQGEVGPKTRGKSGLATTISMPGTNAVNANGGGGGGSHGNGTNYHGLSGGNGGGGGGRYGTTNRGNGGTANQSGGKNGGEGNVGGGGGGGGMNSNGASAVPGSNDQGRYGGNGGGGMNCTPFNVYGAGGGGASAGSPPGGTAGNGGGGTGGRSVNGYASATGATKQGGGGGGGGASQGGNGTENGRAGGHGIIKFAHKI